ncbi:alginate lyase family protein [Amaricoccus solimangrovi]|uniref:Alginate lyase domain-containing protein n=1 Tax=Amaricoccus solimangrovi TaxID=2589815 RepID=A0A501WKX3_9RHOB|nr:alginate lyase family protein [Amaricoccus solimangrovi]TPE49432.1 hypothetical protein FJM51_15025 [Amaricoccus solimangrovi]
MIRSTVILGLGALLVAGCAAMPAGQGAFSQSGAVAGADALFPVARRGGELHANNGATGQPMGVGVCPREKDLTDYSALLPQSLAAFPPGPKPEYTKAPRDFGRAFNTDAYRVLLTQDMGRARRDIDALRAHAERDAWVPAVQSNSAASAVIEGMGSVLPAWQILRQTAVATPEDRTLIDGWLQRAAEYADTHPGENNAGTFRGANDMLWGAMSGDRARFRKGVEQGYMAQLRRMRPDGSFPLETDRGVKALENSSRNIALMVYSAQIGLSGGVDLYATEVDGKSLDDAISFLVRAADNNALVDVYAKDDRNPSPGTPPFRPDSQVSPFGNPSRGWIKLYTDRFPGTELSRALLAHVDLPARIQSDTVGGVVTCYASRI